MSDDNSRQSDRCQEHGPQHQQHRPPRKPKVRFHEIGQWRDQGVFDFPQLDEWKDAIYAKMVKKCGDRAYYIAAINIEETYHGLMSAGGKPAKYEPFDGIVLTDTFQLYEAKQGRIEGTFPENSKRAKRQRQSPIRVVIANPPYSAQQHSENDNNQNLTYPTLDERIRTTYSEKSTANNKKNLFDSYIRAIRWASDRIAGKGVVGLVTNASFIDANNMDGLRACLTDEFTSLYIFNLRGNQRTSGDISRQEGGKIFGSGSRAPIAITLLVKNPANIGKSKLQYYDIGEYLSRDEKLSLIRRFVSIQGIANAKKWVTIKPNPEHDWINQRDPAFDAFYPLGDKHDKAANVIFDNYTQGVLTSRDAWIYQYSSKKLATNVEKMINFLNQQIEQFARQPLASTMKQRLAAVDAFIDRDPKKISWSDTLKADVSRGMKGRFEKTSFVPVCYRPFSKQYAYYDNQLMHRVSQMRSVFPRASFDNLLVCVNSRGSTKEFSAIITNAIPDYEMVSKGQCFPLYLYQEADDDGKLGFDEGEVVDGYRRRDAITDCVLRRFQDAYVMAITKEDIFYYVYGILHSTEYRQRFAADLKKMLPRIPLTRDTKNFWSYSNAGRELAKWHLNYETIEPWPVVEHIDTLNFDQWETFKVRKMSFARPTAEKKEAGEKWDKTKIIYNDHVTVSNIPLEAYDYVVNGKPAVDWVMDRYQMTRDKESGIVNDPNDWCREHDNPRYIVDLIGGLVRVSIETMKIVKTLPALNEV
jgi:predicted helicase